MHAGSYEDAHTEMCASCHGPRMPGPRYGQAAACKGTHPDVTRREHPAFTGARVPAYARPIRSVHSSSNGYRRIVMGDVPGELGLP